MPIRNAHWYSINEGISYPVDEIASCIDDAGKRLPSNIIVDLHLRWPQAYGQYAFLSSVTVTDALLSLTFQVADDLDTVTGCSPLAVITVPRTFGQSKQVALLPQLNGVGGWVVFGAGLGETYRGRFSTPRQSLLTARAAQSYRALPLTGLRAVDAAAALSGVVSLRAVAPLAITAETRTIEGVDRQCVVVQLVSGEAAGDYPIPEAATTLIGVKTPNIFEQFSGPCAGRPESTTCGDPQPIEFINAVGPDCDGQLTIEFQGCANVAQIQDVCGIVIDCGLGLVDACRPPQIPDSDGYLPSERDPVNIPTPDDPTPDPPPEAISESVVVIGGLPYMDCFASGVAPYFVVSSGLWSLESVVDDGWSFCPVSESLSAPTTYVYATGTIATRNISLWEGFDESTLGRTFATRFRMFPTPSGGKHNAGIVINYRPHATASGLFVYYLAEVDYDTQSLVLKRFNGTTFQTAITYSIAGVLLEKWYSLEVTTELANPPYGSQVAITMRFRSVEDVTFDVTVGAVLVTNFMPSSGYFGLHANRALTYFNGIQLEEP